MAGTSSGRHRRRSHAFDWFWLLILLVALSLTIALVLYQPLRYQAGGKWVVLGLVIAVVFLIYLQPPVQKWFAARSSGWRDAREKRWWANRDRREARAHLRREAFRQGKNPDEK